MQSLFEQMGDDFMYAGADNTHLVKHGKSVHRGVSGTEHGFYFYEIQGSRHFTKCLKHTFGEQLWEISFTIQAEKHYFIGISSEERFESCEECIEKMLVLEQRLSKRMIEKLIHEKFMPGKDVPIDFILED